jgi:hypothetical protein
VLALTTHCCAGQVCLTTFLNDLGRGLFTSGPDSDVGGSRASMLWATANQACILPATSEALKHAQKEADNFKQQFDASRFLLVKCQQLLTVSQQKLGECQQQLTASHSNHISKHNHDQKCASLHQASADSLQNLQHRVTFTIRLCIVSSRALCR